MMCIGLHARALKHFTDGVNGYMWKIHVLKVGHLSSLAG